MAFFTRGNARIHFEENGRGEPVIAVHGLIENTRYWRGVSDILGERVRFISMDMRAHGNTVVDGEPAGYDAQTIGEDIMALADHLGIQRFHLLTHSTGGFAAVRRAMQDCRRFKSLILTNTGSATAPVPADPESIRAFNDKFASWFERYDWDMIAAGLKVKPGPFFRGIVESEASEEIMARACEMMKAGDRNAIAAFVRSFYTDPDPRVEGLRKISCPVLVITGEKDDLFLESSRLMAREIPGARLIEYQVAGHMTALEVPELLAEDLIAFIETHRS